MKGDFLPKQKSETNAKLKASSAVSTEKIEKVRGVDKTKKEDNAAAVD